jgi:RNA polymerase sigma-70 factor (ECF subfamily)
LDDDAQLARGLLQGRADAWETLVRRFHRKVWNVAYHFVGRAEEADELTQEIFVRVFEGIQSFDPSGSFPAWLLRVARNHSIDHYRRRKLEKTLTSREDPAEAAAQAAGSGPDPQALLERKDLAAWIRAALDRLPDELRQAVLLRDLREMSYEEMAAVMEVPLGTVKSRLNRGRLELARLLRLRRREWSSGLQEVKPQ